MIYYLLLLPFSGEDHISDDLVTKIYHDIISLHPPRTKHLHINLSIFIHKYIPYLSHQHSHTHNTHILHIPLHYLHHSHFTSSLHIFIEFYITYNLLKHITYTSIHPFPIPLTNDFSCTNRTNFEVFSPKFSQKNFTERDRKSVG